MPFRFNVFVQRDIVLGIGLLALGSGVSGMEQQGGVLPIWLSQTPEVSRPDQDKVGSRPLSPTPRAEDLPKKVLYVSMAMGMAGIQQAIREADQLMPHHAELTLVFQGLPKGETLSTFSQHVRSLLPLLEKEKRPLITLDPIRFSQHQIVKVPVLMLEGHEQIIPHDGGRLRPTMKVSEENLVERLKARMKAFDWSKVKNDYEREVVGRHPMIKLPEATQPVSRTFTLSMRVPYDLRTPEGKLLAEKGAIINPLTLPLPPLHLWVFNPFAESQMEATLKLLREHPESSITLIASQWDQQQGLLGLKELERRLNHRLTLLTPLLQERLGITHLPVEITQEGKSLHVQERPPKSDPA